MRSLTILLQSTVESWHVIGLHVVAFYALKCIYVPSNHHHHHRLASLYPFHHIAQCAMRTTTPDSVKSQPNQRHRSPPEQSSPFPTWQKLVAIAGLPCLISVAAIDPGNLEVDLQAGVQLGYRLIWALVLSSVVGWVLQTLSAHLAILSGAHLAEICARAYRNDSLLSAAVFIFIELSIVAFDVAEVVGTAFALQLLLGWPLWLGMVMSALDTMLVLYLQQRGLSKVEIIIEGMLFILAICLLYEFVLSHPNIAAMVSGAVVPSLGNKPGEGAILAIGILGSVVMSHNLFLHSWLVKQRNPSEQQGAEQTAATELWSGEDTFGQCRYATLEAGAIFLATFVINACVVAITAALPADALAHISGDLGLKDAGALLRNVLDSRFASVAWGIALLASGHAATVTGTLASQAVCEGFLGVQEGVSSTWMVLLTRLVAILPALFVALVVGEKGSDRLIVLSQVVISLSLPFAVIPVFKGLEVVREGLPGHTVWLLNVGYVSFASLVAANGFVVCEIGRQVWMESGPVAFWFLVGWVVGATVLIVRLLVTPVDLSEMDLATDHVRDGEEGRKLIDGETGTMYR